MKLTRRKLLSGAAATALLPREADAWTHGSGGGVFPANFLTNTVGVAAGSLNMLPWTAQARFTDFTNAQWSFLNTTVTTGVSSPDGGTNSAHLKETSATGTHTVNNGGQLGTQIIGLVPLRVAAIVKQAERTRCVIGLSNGTDANSNVSVCFDLAGGQTNFSNVVGSNMTLVATAITAISGGYFLCTFDFVYKNLTEGVTYNWAAFIATDAGSGTAAQNISYAGSVGSGINLFWFNIMPTAAWSMTSLAFLDDFNSLGSIDLTNSKAPGFNWYLNQAFNHSAYSGFSWNGAVPSPGANFTLASPSVLKIFNPGAGGGGTSGMQTTVTDDGNGYIGQAFPGPQMRDAYLNWNAQGTLPTTGGFTGPPAWWGVSTEGQTNTGLNPSFHFLEWDVVELGLTATQLNAFQHMIDWSDPPNGAFHSNQGSLNSFSSSSDPTFHRLSSVWVPATTLTSGWGVFVFFLDGQFAQGTYSPYNRAIVPNTGLGIAPGAWSQSDWHNIIAVLDTGESGSGGWPLLVDWVRIYTNPSPPVVYSFWDIFDQAGIVQATASGGLLVLDTNGLQLTKTTNDAAWDTIRASHGKGAGKWYWEITITGTVATATSLMLGMVNQAASVASGAFPGSSSAGAGARNGSNWNAFATGVTTPFSGTVGFITNDVFGFAFDADGGNVYIHRNGTWINGVPSGGSVGAVWTGLTTASPGINAAGWYPAVAIHDTTAIATANFGQSAFAFAVPSGYNSGLF